MNPDMKSILLISVMTFAVGCGSSEGNGDVDAGLTPDAAVRRAPEIGTGDGTPASITLTEIAGPTARLQQPRDLEFNPMRPDELWVVNYRDDSVTIIHDASKDTRTTEYRKDGYALHFMAEVTAISFGQNETTPRVGKPGTFGVEFKESFLSLHLNRPLVGQRTNDVLSVVNEVVGKAGGEVIAVGATAPAALHAAALDTRVASLTVENCLVSWDAVVRTPIHHNQLVNVVPGALAVYDLPDLAAAVAPRPLTIRNPVDAAGKPLTKEAAEEAYKAVRAAYKAAGASDKFTLEAGGK